MKIRKAIKKDLDQLWKLEKLFNKFDKKVVLKEFIPLLNLSKDAKKIFYKNKKKLISKKNYCILVAEKDKKIIGYIQGWIKKIDEIYRIRQTGCLEDIFIIKKYRGKGISDKLKDELFKWFKSKKIKYIGLHVFCKNKHAINTYRKWGFKIHTLKLIKILK